MFDSFIGTAYLRSLDLHQKVFHILFIISTLSSVHAATYIDSDILWQLLTVANSYHSFDT